MLKLKFIWNRAALNVTNNTQETVIFEPNEMIGVLDLRLLGDYKIKARCSTTKFEQILPF